MSGWVSESVVLCPVCILGHSQGENIYSSYLFSLVMMMKIRKEKKPLGHLVQRFSEKTYILFLGL